MLRGGLVVVAGGGFFGTKAVRFAKEAGNRVIVVDNVAECDARRYVVEVLGGGQIDEAVMVKAGSAVLVISDAVEFLSNLMEVAVPDCIVPSVPGHLAGKLIKHWLERRGFVVKYGSKALSKIKREIPRGLVIYQDEGKGLLITSYMPTGGLCRVPCNQPVDICPTSGRRKAGTMSDILTKATRGKVTISKILASHNLKGEVGYFEGGGLASFLSDCSGIEPPFDIAIGTACGCHGILNLFTVRSRQGNQQKRPMIRGSCRQPINMDPGSKS
jgi:hypothetical protein